MLLWLTGWIARLWLWLRPRKFHGRRKPVEPMTHRGWHPKKPPQVRARIIEIKAMGPDLSYREVAAAYNRGRVYRGITVGKAWVGEVIRASKHEIEVRRKQVRNRRLTAGPRNITWAVDLTGKTDTGRSLHYLLGAVDHGARACLTLNVLKQKTTVAILRLLLDCIELHGKPKYIRTDNERIFTSRLFRFGLWLLDIKHQLTDVGCPWQNGRMERFFGTLKRKLDLWSVDNREQLEESLRLFRIWYNHVRPHQHLSGMTPAEAWDGENIQSQPPKDAIWFDAWDGLLAGYYLRR